MKPTVQDRVLLHLDGYRRYREAYAVPADMTQMGIALSIGVTRAHAAIVLRTLLEQGLMEKRLARILRKPRKLITYHLTPAGEEEAPGILDALGLKQEDGRAGERLLAPAEKRVADRKYAAAALLEKVHHLEEQLAVVKRKVEMLTGEM